jgi:hypothetical protein
MLAYIFLFVYNMTLLGGTAYIITFHGWSPWWMLMPLLLVMTFSNAEKSQFKKTKKKS